MNEAAKTKLIIRQAIFWVLATTTPTIVMVVLDLFEKHTPNNIVMFSLICQIAIMGGALQHLRVNFMGSDIKSDNE